MKSDYDNETVEDYEARPPGRSSVVRPAQVRRHKRERWLRIAEGGSLSVLSSGGYSYTQHCHDRENARRRRHQQERHQ